MAHNDVPNSSAVTRDALRCLLTAKRLLRVAEPLCLSGEKHAASAGLLALQDAVELVLLACIEMMPGGEDEFEHSDDFRKLIKEAQRRGVKVSKPDVLASMNRMRGIVKHQGRVAEPGDVAAMLRHCTIAIDKALDSVCKSSLHEIFLHQLVEGESRVHLMQAEQDIEAGRGVDALVSVRRAIFLEFETEYAVDDYETATSDDQRNPFFSLFRGWKAPWHTRDPKWIKKNVAEPTRYVQIDDARLSLDLLEMGVSPRDFQSVRRMTPAVFLRRNSIEWCVRAPIESSTDEKLLESARWCLDRTTEFLLAKQEHLLSLRRHRRAEVSGVMVLVDDSPLYARASTKSDVLRVLPKGSRIDADCVVNALDSEAKFVSISHVRVDPSEITIGFVPVAAGTLEVAATSDDLDS